MECFDAIPDTVVNGNTVRNTVKNTVKNTVRNVLIHCQCPVDGRKVKNMVDNTVRSTAGNSKSGIVKKKRKERHNFDFTGPSRRTSLLEAVRV